MSTTTFTHIETTCLKAVEGSDQPWLCWSSLNRLHTGIGRAKTTMRRWGYTDTTQSVKCDCGERQTMDLRLCCRRFYGRLQHPHRAGKGACLEVAIHCTNGTIEEKEEASSTSNDIGSYHNIVMSSNHIINMHPKLLTGTCWR